MSYAAQAQMTDDHGLKGRIAACAGSLGIADARVWVERNVWTLVTRDGWGERYEKASENDPPFDPAAWYGVHGLSPDVITDAMIRASVEGVLADEAATLADRAAAAASQPNI